MRTPRPIEPGRNRARATETLHVEQVPEARGLAKKVTEEQWSAIVSETKEHLDELDWADTEGFIRLIYVLHLMKPEKLKELGLADRIDEIRERHLTHGHATAYAEAHVGARLRTIFGPSIFPDERYADSVFDNTLEEGKRPPPSTIIAYARRAAALAILAPERKEELLHEGLLPELLSELESKIHTPRERWYDIISTLAESIVILFPHVNKRVQELLAEAPDFYEAPLIMPTTGRFNKSRFAAFAPSVLTVEASRISIDENGLHIFNEADPTTTPPIPDRAIL